MPIPVKILEQYKEFSLKYKIAEKIQDQYTQIDEESARAQGDYSTGGAHAEALNREKLKQRRKLANEVEDDDGTVIEMFAGRGNLTNAVWKPHSKKNILIEYNADTVKEYTSKIVDPDRSVIYQMSNIDFAEEHLKEIPPEDITAIDFDAFGSVIPIITKTLEHFKPVRPLVVGITDGIGSNLVRISRQKDELLNRLTELGYVPMAREGLNMNMYMIKVISKTMELIAKDHGLSCEKINGTHNRKSTVYCGYVLKPL
jgi:hypothetical protein